MDLGQLARQGDSQAIAALLKQAFEKQGVVVKVNRKDRCFQVLLEAPRVPNQTTAMFLIQEMMSLLQPQGLDQVQVFGRRTRASHYTWQEEFNLLPTSPSPLTNPALDRSDRIVQPSSQASSQASSQKATHPPSSPQRNLARQGDPEAIATWLNDLLASKQITTQVRWQDYSLHIILTAPTAPPQTQTLTWLDRELTDLDAFMIQKLVVQGRETDHDTPAWQAEFDLGAYAHSKAEPPLKPDAPVPIHAINPIHSAHPASAIDAPVPVPPAKPISQPVRLSPTRRTAPTPPPAKLYSQAVTTQGWSAVLSGLVLAIVLFALGPLKLLFRGFLVMVHEVGHALTHWLFGRPAIPMVDFAFGGGLTINFEQSWAILVLIYAAIAFLIFLCRVYPRLQGVVVLFTLLYSFCLLTSWNLILSTFMGHGMELMAIFVCLYLAISGYFCRMGGDRSIYAMLGFFTFFCDLQFSWQLLYDTDFQDWYGEGKGGMIDNDFVILAGDYFGVDLAAVVYVFLALCIVTPIVAFVLFRYEPWLRAGFRKLLETP